MPEAMDGLKTFVIALVTVAILGAALAIAIDEFQDQIGEDGCAADSSANNRTSYNDTGKTCYNSGDTLNTSSTQPLDNDQWNVTNEGLRATANSTGYLDTIGTLIGVGALVAVVVFGFYAFRR